VAPFIAMTTLSAVPIDHVTCIVVLNYTWGSTFGTYNLVVSQVQIAFAQLLKNKKNLVKKGKPMRSFKRLTCKAAILLLQLLRSCRFLDNRVMFAYVKQGRKLRKSLKKHNFFKLN